MIRATTGGVMKTYRSSLMKSFISMNNSMNTVLSQRTFNTFAEDPASAARAFRLRKARMTVESQSSVCADVYKKYETALACLQSNDDIICTKEGEYGYYMNTLTGTTLSMLNDPEGDARTQLAKVLDQISRSVIQTMNQKYGDSFVFAGADGYNVPFEIKKVDGKDRLFYRGVPVDASMPNILRDRNGDPVMLGKGGNVNPDGAYYVNMDNVEAITQAEYDALNNPLVRQTYDDVVRKDASGDPFTFDATGALDPTGNGAYYKITVDGKPYLVSKDDYDPAALVEYNADGTFHTDNDGDVGGYYMTIATDGEGNETNKLISQEEYDAIIDRRDSLLKTKSGDVYFQENADGTKTYYVVNDDPKMTEEEYNALKLDYEKLQYLANEKQFVDIGFGFQEDPLTGQLIESSAFNSSLNGITFLGWGLDGDGDPKNIYSLVQRMREVAESVPDGTQWDTATWNEFDRLVDKFEIAVSNYQTEYVNLDASSGKLKSQSKLLEDNYDNVWTEYSDIEDIDAAEAITAFLWAQYSYNSALRVGNSVLSQSLMDYLS